MNSGNEHYFLFLFIAVAKTIAKKIMTKPNAITFTLNCVISKPEESSPIRGKTGIFPMVKGVLNFPLKFGLR